jgi:hypothetical protein
MRDSNKSQRILAKPKSVFLTITKNKVKLSLLIAPLLVGYAAAAISDFCGVPAKGVRILMGKHLAHRVPASI